MKVAFVAVAPALIAEDNPGHVVPPLSQSLSAGLSVEIVKDSGEGRGEDNGTRLAALWRSELAVDECAPDMDAVVGEIELRLDEAEHVLVSEIAKVLRAEEGGEWSVVSTSARSPAPE